MYRLIPPSSRSLYFLLANTRKGTTRTRGGQRGGALRSAQGQGQRQGQGQGQGQGQRQGQGQGDGGGAWPGAGAAAGAGAGAGGMARVPEMRFRMATRNIVSLYKICVEI